MIKKDKKSKILFWTPRVLAILFILFLSLFSLDVFDQNNNYSFGETLLALFMHNIPSLVLIIFLVIAWKWEWVGALGFFLFAIIYMAFIIRKILNTGFEVYYLSWFLTISGPAIIVGLLWWMNWNKKKKSKKH